MHNFIQSHTRHESAMIITATLVIKVWTRHHGHRQPQECPMSGSLGTGYPPSAGVSLWQLLALLLTTFLNCVITHPQILLNLLSMLLNLPLRLLNPPFLQRLPMIPSFSQSMKYNAANQSNQWIPYCGGSEPMGRPKGGLLVGHWLFPYEFFCFCISLFPWTETLAEIWIWFYFWLHSIIRILPDNGF